MRKLLPVLALILLLPMLPLSTVSGVVTGTPTVPSALSIISTPPKLPADGGEYASVIVSMVDANDLPSIALTNTVVFLTSSLSDVGALPSSAIILAGQPYAAVNFTTTTTPGTTTITASSSGLASATTAIETYTPSGFPSHIELFATPGSLLASPNDSGTITVELTDATGLPAKATSNVPIQLFSSDVATVGLSTANVTVESNQVLGFATFKTSFLPGEATITASASGFTSGSAQVQVVGPAPLKLNILPQPDKIVVGSTGTLVLSLTDLSGNPARTPTAITVNLISSDLGAVTVQTTATISPGSIYTTASYTASSTSGNATLTASSPGLESSSAYVSTANPGSEVSLKIWLAPNPVLSDDQSFDAILVGIVNKTGYAAPAASDVTVQLTSSSSLIGSVAPSITIPAGSSYVATTFQSTYASGTTLITASASNLLPAQAMLTTYGPVPARLSVQGVPLVLPADGGTYQALSIGLADSSGGPAVAPQNIVVQLSSSDADAVIVNSEAVIKQGEISTVVNVQTSLLADSANITASAVGLGSATALFTTVTPAPSKLALYIAPAATFSGTSRTSPLFVVQLQDSAGNPARARQATTVVVTSSNSLVLNNTITLVIGAGLDYATGFLDRAGAGMGTFTASSPGLGSSSADLQVLQYPVVFTLVPAKTSIYENQMTSLLLTATFQGVPISNASITWLAHGGFTAPVNGTTNVAGEASTEFRPDAIGPANVTAVLQTPALGSLNFTAPISVLPIPPNPPLTTLQVIRGYIFYIIIAAVAVVIASVYLVRSKGKKARAELEAGFEVVS